MNETFPGIVIREMPSGENGKLLYVLTADRGVVRINATGARKLTASYLKSVQMFAYSRLTVYEKNGHMTLTEAELIEGFYYIRKDLVALAFASYACEMAYISAVPDDSSVLRLLLNTLYAVSNAIAPINIIKAVFELKLCCVSGLMPDIEDGCAVCGDEAAGFCMNELEPRCAVHAVSGGEFIPLCAAARRIVSFVCGADYSKMLSFRASPDAIEDFCAFCESFMTASMEVNPKTLQFYREISRKKL